MRNEKFLKAGVVAFILFIVFSWVVSKGYLSNLDLALTAAFQNLIPGVFVTPFSVFSILGSFEVTILILIVLLFLVKRVNKIGIIILIKKNLPFLFNFLIRIVLQLLLFYLLHFLLLSL